MLSSFKIDLYATASERWPVVGTDISIADVIAANDDDVRPVLPMAGAASSAAQKQMAVSFLVASMVDLSIESYGRAGLPEQLGYAITFNAT